MSQNAVIAIDAMGGDEAPAIVVDGVAIAERVNPGGARYQLHGDRRLIAPLLEAQPDAASVCEVYHAETKVEMGDKPSEALRRARGSSMWNAVEAVKKGEAQAVVSAGNTGALMAISKIVLRMAANVHRPAIAASWPTPGAFCVVLDVGATVEASARQLIEFAIMGEAYARAVHGHARPSVGLLNVGAEDVKGNAIVREADQLLRESDLDLNYRGFVEGHDISLGTTDVVVTDGFTGNVALKTAEGMARLVGGWVREALTSDTLAKAGALLSRHALRGLRDRMDPRNVNGGVFLGLNGVVVKSHGGTDGQGFATALRIAGELARSNFSEEVTANLSRFAEAAEARAAAETAEAVR